MKVCFIDPDNVMHKRKPELMTFDNTSTERAELEHFARAIQAGEALAVPGGDEVHNVAVLDAIVESARKGLPVPIPT
jgi:predicted dehydrogenase